jgi:citrate synthase
MSGARNDVSDWWSTAIIDMAPGQIRLRGHPIEELIGAVTFPQMIWLMTRGDMPSRPQARLLEHALVAAVDHGPQAPSIAAARMAVTCGLGPQRGDGLARSTCWTTCMAARASRRWS